MSPQQKRSKDRKRQEQARAGKTGDTEKKNSHEYPREVARSRPAAIQGSAAARARAAAARARAAAAATTAMTAALPLSA